MHKAGICSWNNNSSWQLCTSVTWQDFICVVFNIDWLFLPPVSHENHNAFRDIFAQARNQIRIRFDSIFLCTYGECVCLSFGNPDCWDQSMIILTDFNQHFKWHARPLCKKIRFRDARELFFKGCKKGHFWWKLKQGLSKYRNVRNKPHIVFILDFHICANLPWYSTRNQLKYN